MRVVRVVRVVRFGAPADEAPDAAVRSLEVGTPETPDPETRTVGLVECEVTTADGKVAAYAVSTCMTLRGEAAAGR